MLGELRLRRPLREMTAAQRYYFISALGTIGCEILNNKASGDTLGYLFVAKEGSADVHEDEVAKIVDKVYGSMFEGGA